jgi:pyridoxine 4-dehydrogenase
MGRGMLTGQFKSYNDIPEKDVRRILPRFQPDVFENNIKLVKELEVISKRKSCTTAQLALSWLLSVSKKPGMPVIIPIPGATTAERVKENAVEVEITEEEMKEIDNILATFEVIGDTYHSFGMKLADG